MDSAVKWTQAHGECPSGDPHLQQYIGEMYYKGRISSNCVLSPAAHALMDREAILLG